MSGIETKTQKITSDDSIRFQNVILNPGYYDNQLRIINYPSNSTISIPYYAGNAYAARERIIRIWADTRALPTNGDENSLYTINKLAKFDGEAFEPIKQDNIYFFPGHAEFSGNGLEYKMWFATKKDGTNWTSQQEMNSTDVDELILYENIEDIPQNYICVGEYFENIKGNLTNGYSIINYFLKVKETATIGKTYAFTQVTKGWTENLDRNIYTATNSEVHWPKAVFNSSNRNYIKTEYDSSMNVKSGTHNGGISYGQSVLITGAEMTINKKAIDTTTRKDKTNYDFSKNEYNVHYVILPSLKTYTENVDLSSALFKIEDTLPKGVSYVANSCNILEPEIESSSDGTTKLIWYLSNISSINNIPSIEYDAHLSEDFSNGTNIETKAIIREIPYEDGNGNVIYRIGNLPSTNNQTNQSSVSIQVINLASHRLYKIDNTPVIEKNGEIHFTLSYKNNTDETIPDFQLLDILPYNGDDRGTNFTGTYTLDRIVVSKEDASNARAVGNMQVLYTNSEDARNVTSKDENLGNGWTVVTSENIKQSATAIVVKGEVEAQGKVVVDIYLKTSDNKGLDKYVNSATAQVYKATEEMTTSNVVSQVVERTIEGIAWEDINANGIKDEEEEVLKNIELTLTDSLGNQVTDVNGNIVNSVRTNENGYYKFKNLPKGNYYIGVTISNSTYEITEKEIGSNSQINSKFNVEAKETDEITKLNSIDLPILTASNINVGFVKKATSIVVKHQTEAGEDLVEPEVIEGRIDESYKTQDKANEFNNYELKIKPENAEGTMKAEQIEVVYVYSLVKGKITITKVDKNDETKYLSGATFKVEKLDNSGNIDTTFTPIENTTGESGIVEFTDLLVGKYRITETKAPYGYELAKNTIDVEITKTQKELNVKATDKLKLILPETGKINFSVYISLIGICIILVTIVIRNRKKSTSN